MPRPPALPLLAYRFLGWRLGPAHKDWVLDDILRPGWLLRAGAPAIAAVLLIGSALAAAVGGSTDRLLTVTVVMAAVGAFLRSSLRERALRQQGLDPSGRPLPTATWWHDDRARLRRNVLGAVGTVVMVVGALLLVALRSRP
ncbi:MAG: hypothetical protein WCD35_09590 [Mycobacteriales bacterium]